MNKKLNVRDLTLISLCASVITICAWITIPFGEVPFTLQTFGIFLSLLVLGGKKGTIAILVYILLGVIGLPVFSGFRGGIGTLIGPTGGYIIGFVFQGIIYMIFELISKENKIIKLISLILGLFACYLFGSVWLVLMYQVDGGTLAFTAIILLYVVPYLIPDVLKLVTAYSVATKIKKYLK